MTDTRDTSTLRERIAKAIASAIGDHCVPGTDIGLAADAVIAAIPGEDVEEAMARGAHDEFRRQNPNANIRTWDDLVKFGDPVVRVFRDQHRTAIDAAFGPSEAARPEDRHQGL